MNVENEGRRRWEAKREGGKERREKGEEREGGQEGERVRVRGTGSRKQTKVQREQESEKAAARAFTSSHTHEVRIHPFGVICIFLLHAIIKMCALALLQMAAKSMIIV